MKITIDKSDKTPVYLQIAGQIKESIYAGIIPDGYVLPSERALSAEIGVHRNTVTKAYDELKTEDIIESVQGKHCRVSFGRKRDEGVQSKAGLQSRAGLRPKDVNWDALIRREYSLFRTDFDDLYSRGFDSRYISFAGGVASGEIYPPEEIASVFERVIRSKDNKAYFYTTYQGDPELRKEIAGYMASKGIKATAANVQIFSENNQALDFILSLMLSPGDAVIIEDTMSADVYRTIEVAGGRLITVPTDENGMICDMLDAVIEKEKPKFIYVDSSFNNPSGTILPMERRQKLLELSYRYRIPIIEEDEGSELYYGENPVPSIKSMDRGGNVIYMYSFSLTMIPGIGMSFVIADRKLIKQFAGMVSLRITNTDWTAQMVMLEYMKNGLFIRRLEDFRTLYKTKRDRMCRRLDKLVTRYGLEYRKPEGGVYLWVRIPGRASSRKLLEEAQKRGLTFMPGYVFFTKPSMGRSYFRLNYSYPSEEEIEKGMDILVEAIDEVMR